MTVEELIARLRKCNPKAMVVGKSFDGLSYFELDTISGKVSQTLKAKVFIAPEIEKK